MPQSMSVFRWLPCPVVFICTAHEGRRDIMTATAQFVSEKDPLLTVSVAGGHLTDRLIDGAGEFVLAVASTSQKTLAVELGSSRGEAGDKYDLLHLACLTQAPAPAGVPQDSAAWMRCRVEQRQEIPGYTVRIARVVESADLNRPPLVWHRDGFFGLGQ
jgi:flavin reductase (DIM6/NTAB) family NADH-FMN oxidoreductase RutF